MEEKAVVVRRVRAGDGPAFREIRIQSLIDAPWAFAATLAATRAQPPAYFEQRVLDAAAGDDNALFFAEIAGTVIGVVGGAVFQGGDPELISMWVHPEHRGSGTARRLVETVQAWAIEAGHVRMTLWVLVGNEPARRLYEACGFRVTGDTGPLQSDPTLTDEKMVCVLSRAPVA